MSRKKQLIISAFENLDADGLDKLLDDNRTYQNVTKGRFVERFREFSSGFTENEEFICDFKAYSGTCDGCKKGMKGYSFVNSQGVSFGDFIFEEKNGEFMDVCKCSNFHYNGIDVSAKYDSFDFYKDEKADFILTFDELVEKEFCLSAVKKIENLLIQNKVFPLDQVKDWFNEFYPIYGGKFYDTENYSFIVMLQSYLDEVRHILKLIDLSKKAAFYLRILKDPVFKSTEAKIMWMLSCLENIPNIKLDSFFRIDHEKGFARFDKINLPLLYVQDYFGVQMYFNQYSHLLPYSVLMEHPSEWHIK